MRAGSAIAALLLLAGCAAAPPAGSGPASLDLVSPDYYSRSLRKKTPAPAKRPGKPEAQQEESGSSAGEVEDRMREIETQLRELRRQLGD